MTLSTLSTPPTTADPDSFDTRADLLFGTELPRLVTEINAMLAVLSALAAGSAISLSYKFSTATAGDPGPGYARFNSATQNLTTELALDLVDAAGVTQTPVIDVTDDSTSIVKGHVMAVNQADQTKWVLLGFTALASPAGYKSFTAAVVSSSAASPFAAEDMLVLKFSRTGDKGELGSLGIGAATPASGNVTLTNLSVGAQRGTPTGFGQSFSLPDATTLSGTTQKGVPLYGLVNASQYPMGIKDSTGVPRNFIAPYEMVPVALTDISTAAGAWGFSGGRQMAVTAQYIGAALALGTTTKMKRVALDADRDVILIGDTALYVVVFNRTTGAVGAAVSVRATIGSGLFEAVLAGSAVLVTSCTSTTAFEAVVITVSGVTPTVNTAATATLAGNITSFGNLLAVNAGWVIAYGRATTTSGARAMTISGTTVTIGSETAFTTASATVAHTYVSGTTYLAISSDGTNLYARPYTLAGTTLTLGTAATTTGAVAPGFTAVLGTRWVGTFAVTNKLDAFLVSLTGTIATITTVAITAGSVTMADMAVVNGKALVSYLESSAQKFNLLTDTAGTISIGTVQSIAATAAATVAYVTGVTARAINPTDGKLYTVDCTAATAVVTTETIPVSTTNYSYHGAADTRGGGRNYRNITVNGAGLALPSTVAHTGMLEVGVDYWRIRPLQDVGVLGTYGIAGSTAYESYVAESALTNGVYLKRLAVAQP